MIISKNKNGMAGIVTVVLIMALLASVATSYIKLMQTENSVTVFSEQHQKAADAAFCGISYAMAQLQTQSKLFKSSTTVMDRNYIVKEDKFDSNNSLKSDAKLAGQNLVRAVPSKWNYMDETNMIIDSDEVKAVKPPYMFRVFTYPTKATEEEDKESNTNFSKQYYMVKSQGMYLEYSNPEETDPTKIEVIATHTAQYLAQLKIDRSAKRVFLYRYKPVPYQADNEFYKYLSKIN